MPRSPYTRAGLLGHALLCRIFIRDRLHTADARVELRRTQRQLLRLRGEAVL